MKKDELYIVLHTVFSTLVLLCPGIIALVMSFVVFPYADSGFLSFQATPPKWFELINFSSNAYHFWKFDILIASLSSLIGYDLYMAIIITIFSFGVYFLILEVSPVTRSIALQPPFFASLCSIVLLFLFGFDSVLFPGLCFFPWLLLNLIRIIKNEHVYLHIAFLLIVSIFAARSGNQVSIFYSLVAFFLTVKGLITLPSKQLFIIFCCLFIPSLIAFIATPFTDFPPYAAPGHLVPAIETTDGVRPMLGPEPPITVLDQQYLRNIFGPLALILMLGISGFLVILFRKKLPLSGFQRSCLLTALCFSIMLFFDSALIPIEYNQVAPLQTIRRLLPGFSTISLPPLFFTLGLVLFVIALASGRGRSFLYFLSVTALLVIFPLSNKPFYSPPLLRGAMDQDPWQTFNKKELFEKRDFIVKRLLSPSYYVVKNMGLSVLELQERVEHLEREQAEDYKPVFSASHHEELTKLLTDHNLSTRWSAQKGAQKGDEWLHIYFDTPKLQGGMTLELGPFNTDYPRALEVYSSEHCARDGNDTKRYTLTARFTPWLGSVQFTTDGYPYFTPPQTITILYPQRIKPHCLLIKQTGTEKSFDWSIAEITFIK